jgi:DNA-binding NarL/FixJ family response regulator
MTIRVLLVDDEDLVRAGLRAILNAKGDIEVVGEAVDGAVVVPLVRDCRPDVILMDIRMPLVDGIQATRDLRRRLPQSPPVIIITTFGEDENVYAALQAGAQGFLLKRSAPQEIVDAVRLVARGDSLLFPVALRSLAGRFATATPTDRHTLDKLTLREREVLLLIARGRTNSEVARELNLGIQTIKTHVSSILRKLQARDRVQAVIVAYEAGMVPLV